MTEHSVAKLLDGGEEGRDWRALGNLLGYKEVPFHHHHHLEEVGESDVDGDDVLEHSCDGELM